jgi:hypothetical protein
MTDQETIARFIFLRSQGWSFNRIAVDLNVSKPTLIKWSRLHQFEIQNIRATETEGIIEKVFKSQQERWQKLANELDRIEAEMAKRTLDTVSTGSLMQLAAKLRAEISRETGQPKFSEAVRNIPGGEYIEEVMDWQA